MTAERPSNKYAWILHIIVGVAIGAAIPIIDFRINISEKDAEIQGKLSVYNERLEKLETQEQLIQTSITKLDLIGERLDRIEENMVIVYKPMKKHK